MPVLEPAVSGVPPTVILVIAPLQAASSVNVTLKGASTVAPAAAVRAGGVSVEAVPLNTISFSDVAILPSFIFLILLPSYELKFYLFYVTMFDLYLCRI